MMRTRSTSAFLAVGIASCSMFIGASTALARRPADEPGVATIERARGAAVSQPFTAVVEVSWKDGEGMKTERVNVSGDGKQMYANGIVVGAERFRSATVEAPAVRSKQTPATMPAPTEKYALSTAPGLLLVGRPTTVVTADVQGVMRERWTIDDGTGVLVGREAYDNTGQLTRRVALVELEWTAPASPPTTMAPATETLTEIELTSVQRPYAAPDTVGAGYRIVGRYEMEDGTVHLLYSDGLRDLSVFQQQGDLDWNALPQGGRTETVRGVTTRQYLAPSGWTWIWERNGVVFTVVTDTTADEMPAVVAGLRPASPSLWDQFRSWVRSWFE